MKSSESERTGEPARDSKSTAPLAPGLSDEEFICTWMESKPKVGPFDMRPWQSISVLGWWVAMELSDYKAPNEWFPRRLDLDALWEVEERLPRNERDKYIAQLLYVTLAPDPARYDWRLLHATAAQKIRALGAVLRPHVTARTQAEGSPVTSAPFPGVSKSEKE